MTANAQSRLESAEIIPFEPPRPLRRAPRDPAPYPIDALGTVIGSAVAGVADMVQVPVEIAAHSALANAALAVQGHADVRQHFGETSPLSLFLISVARSGDRKSGADKKLSEAVAEREAELALAYRSEKGAYECEREAFDAARSSAKTGKTKSRDEIRDALEAVGQEPTPPRLPSLTADDPTLEGIHKYLEKGQPSIGVFNDEGSQFSGGVGMSAENQRRTGAGLSRLWDGAPVKRMRAGDGMTTLYGRRVSLHLMMQPGNAGEWIANPELQDQGFFGRILIAAPSSLAGTRLHRDPSPSSAAAISAFNRRAADALATALPVDPESGELRPRTLELSSDAKRALNGFADAVERDLGSGQALEPIYQLAGKAITHATRLAGVIALFEDVRMQEVSAQCAAHGINLMKWYLGEALRLYEAGSVRREIAQAERLLDWLRSSWPALTKSADGGALISPPDVYQLGPNSIRDSKAAKEAIDVLVQHGWLRKVDGAHQVNGTLRRSVFAMVGSV
jgi:hypothetical protein